MNLEKIIIFVLLFFTLSFYSQETEKEITNSSVEKSISDYIEINGLVTDLAPLPNIVVFEKGKDNTVMTDKDGKFLIKIPLKNFTEKVFLRFEDLSLNYFKDIEVLPNTKYIKAELDDKEAFSTKWVIRFEYEKPDVTGLIIKALDKIIASQIKKVKQQKLKK